jgi:hypothetical protein
VDARGWATRKRVQRARWAMQPDPPPGTTAAMQREEGGGVQQPSTLISGHEGRGAWGAGGCSDLAAAAGALDVD